MSNLADLVLNIRENLGDADAVLITREEVEMLAAEARKLSLAPAYADAADWLRLDHTANVAGEDLPAYRGRMIATLSGMAEARARSGETASIF